MKAVLNILAILCLVVATAVSSIRWITSEMIFAEEEAYGQLLRTGIEIPVDYYVNSPAVDQYLQPVHDSFVVALVELPNGFFYILLLVLLGFGAALKWAEIYIVQRDRKIESLTSAARS
ncbi:MAG: hypothetical protein AAB515_00705 [Patescibacteria group bacterium]